MGMFGMNTNKNVPLKSMTFVTDAYDICEVIFVCVVMHVMYYVIAEYVILLKLIIIFWC